MKLHPHIGVKRSQSYKDQLFILMKEELIDFMADQLILAQISEIPRFTNDEEIIFELYKRYD